MTTENSQNSVQSYLISSITANNVMEVKIFIHNFRKIKYVENRGEAN